MPALERHRIESKARTARSVRLFRSSPPLWSLASGQALGSLGIWPRSYLGLEEQSLRLVCLCMSGLTP